MTITLARGNVCSLGIFKMIWNDIHLVMTRGDRWRGTWEQYGVGDLF